MISTSRPGLGGEGGSVPSGHSHSSPPPKKNRDGSREKREESGCAERGQVGIPAMLAGEVVEGAPSHVL
jgi:hypothetical protein